ncbi:hypothetical protein GGI03_003244 [Coemansia sp. RSA 2337]|nr:hypothetical protein H4S03_003229 [Coemansia sp. S3946]KAJ2051325.1 hypothetical protein H4S04_002052 [Coemansia sp. S16]KAJ2069679.1 hypothetical protein GGI08_000223 [Coemansia sp. S2]KAJ2073397.1 hypothetical protein GGH13_002023 [Coemansia sp. S155-1]KAJ2102756.1 hypothetical protein GGI09_001040 [Coemansia sp. S100]KAJ2105426.1 hypothetical protein GGI16_002359 [Coemansia sp. S142-1]KAJ2116841.1 hypothetical protein IW146_001206 [Coemansia sp. RSA 922]KAJ2353185.1 hypothetical protei
MSTTMTPEQRVSTVFQTLERAKNVDVTIGLTTLLDSALVVANVAKHMSADEETILAALLQDIGLFCPPPENWSDNPSQSASDIGADYLRKFGFPKKTCELIKSEILVKRYIVTTDFVYFKVFKDSPLAGKWIAPLSPEEMSELEKDPLFHQKVQIRKWKAGIWNPELPPPLDTYRDMAIRNIQI